MPHYDEDDYARADYEHDEQRDWKNVHAPYKLQWAYTTSPRTWFDAERPLEWGSIAADQAAREEQEMSDGRELWRAVEAD